MNRANGILFIFFLFIVILVDLWCKDITGAVFLLTIGVSIVIDSFIHKNKSRRRKSEIVCTSKDSNTKPTRNLSDQTADITHKIPKNRNCD